MLFVGLLLQNEMMSHKHKPDFIILLLIYHPQIMITSLPIHTHKSWIQVVLTASPNTIYPQKVKISITSSA